MPTGYIFIVGLPRTGTTLTRNLLNCSVDVAIGQGESHYFGGPRFFGILKRKSFQQKLAKVGNLSSDDDLIKVADFLYNSPQNNFWGAISRNLPREEFLQRLLTSNQRERCLFELAILAGAHGKALGGEKTPAHLYVVPTLLEWFPGSKIIHTFRDPRAVYVSEKRKYDTRKKLPFMSVALRKLGLIFELYASLDIIVAWKRAIRYHHHYAQMYPNNYYFSKYEDFVVDPRHHLQKMCDFLEIDFTEAMLEQSFTNSSFVPRNQMRGFDTAAIERWRQSLHPVVAGWFNLWCKKQFLEFGYQP